MYIKPVLRYTSGKPAHIGDKIRVADTSEKCYLRAIGERGYISAWHSTWPVARVYHISEIIPGHAPAGH